MTVSVDLLNGPQVARQLASIAPEMRRGTTRAIVQGGAPIVAQAKANAAWSSRIPGAITMRPSYAGSRAGIYIRGDSKIAPHLRPYEGAPGNDTFRHRVYGRDVWVTQATRPVIAPAIRAGQPRVRAGIEQAISDALRV
jgi:hypothetical protein